MRFFDAFAQRSGITPNGRRMLAHRGVLMAFIVGVPLFGIATAEGLKAQLQYEHRSTTQPPDRLRQLGETRSHLNLLEMGSGAAGLLGAALLSGMRVAGWAARRRRSVYLRWARSGVRWAAAGALALTVTHAAVAIAAIWFVGGSLFPGFRAEITFSAAIGAAAYVAAMARHLASLIRPPATAVIAKPLAREHGVRMYQRIEQLAEDLDAQPPRQIVLGLESGCFSTDATLQCADGTTFGRTFYCSLPLLRVISLSEFDALAGHELRHPTTGPTQIGEPSRSLALLPALLILDYLDDAFALAESNHSRERELAADRDAARVAHPLDVASAFAKAHAMAELWSRIQCATPQSSESGPPPKNVSKAAAELAISNGSMVPVDLSDAAILLIDEVEAVEELLSARSELSVEKPPERRPSSMTRRTALLLAIVLGTVPVHTQESYRVVPKATSILGIPVARLDPEWTLASLVGQENLTAESMRYLESTTDTAYRFAADGDFNGDGRRDRAVVGVYRTRKGEEGQFLLIVTKRRPGTWTPTYLSKNSGFAGPSLLYPQPERLNWVPCISCDVGAMVSWRQGRYRAEWVRTDE